jgi:RNA polymerase sigma factor (sigma-70 family)
VIGSFRPRLVGGRDVSSEPQLRFRDTMLPHLDAAYNLARYLTVDATLAEDLTQDAFLRAFRAFDTYKGGPPRAWLFAIVRNCWRDRVGEKMRRDRVVISEVALSEGQVAELSAVADDSDTPETALARAREIDTVRGVIGDLPEPFRETLVLREIEELSYREIAQVTGVPVGTVMSRLSRARELLAKLLLPTPVAGQQERQA